MHGKNYWPTGDIIRVAGILGVLFIHITEFSLRNPNNPTELDLQWWLLNLGQSLSIWAVPGFIMLSGALLLNPKIQEESSSTFYQKRLKRIGLPLVFWILVYLPFQHWYTSQPFPYLARKILYGYVSGHLYFLFIVAGLYLLTPWLRHILNQSSPQQKLVFCIAFFIFIAGIQLANQLTLSWRWNALNRWVPHLGYYVIGHYIVNYALDKLGFFMLLSTIGILTTTGGKYLEIIANPNGVLFFYSTNYFSFTLIPLAIGFFGLLVCLTQSISVESKLVNICRFLAPTTFGIYLVHPIFLRGMHKLFNTKFPSHFEIALLHEVGLGLASILVVYGIGLIPGLRSVVSCHTQKLFTSIAPNS
ncbi:MAG: acyltransferase family protein [Symploca sp. SIO1A3]|nr:acyltransferase family protein [Symploca sp. SIO1A3]